MPDSTKAILDPFASMSVGDALMVALCGMVVVFIVLAVLAAMINIISWVVRQLPAKQTDDAPAAKAAPAVPQKVEDDAELIAVITAAVAAEMGTTPDQTRLTSIIRY